MSRDNFPSAPSPSNERVTNQPLAGFRLSFRYPGEKILKVQEVEFRRVGVFITCSRRRYYSVLNEPT